VTDSATFPIVLPGFPIALFLEARRHNEALVREFTFIVEAEPAPSDSPVRLLALARELRERFYGLNANLEAQVDAAVANGDAAIDLQVRVAAFGREAALTLGALFDEADAFCRNGELLTLAESEDVHDFRTWYIEEVVRQLDGGPPIAWPDWRAQRVRTRS
jgi:hypothetical protein